MEAKKIKESHDLTFPPSSIERQTTTRNLCFVFFFLMRNGYVRLRGGIVKVGTTTSLSE